MKHVTELDKVYGSSYDIIIKINADTTDKLNHIISSKIRRIEKVRATQTMMVIESQDNMQLKWVKHLYKVRLAVVVYGAAP